MGTCEMVIAIPLCDISAKVFIMLYITTATPSKMKNKTYISMIIFGFVAKFFNDLEIFHNYIILPFKRDSPKSRK